MATKKLKVELELETAKAKKKLDGLGETGGTSATGGSAVSTAADKLAKSMNDAGDATAKMSGQTKALITGFSGLAINLAGNYAASYMREGSAGRKAVEYGSSILGGATTGVSLGASVGSVIPGLGTVAGGIIGGVAGAVGGGVTQKMKNDAEFAKNSEAFDRAERNYANNLAFHEFFRSLTRTGKDAMTQDEKLGKAQEQLDKFAKFDEKQVELIRELQKAGKYEQADREIGHLATNRQRRQMLQEYIENAQDRDKDVRTSQAGLDALSRVGGAFTGEGGRGDIMVRVSQEQLDVLKAIERKTGGGMTWQ